jgi:hypothetical protein
MGGPDEETQQEQPAGWLSAPILDGWTFNLRLQDANGAMNVIFSSEYTPEEVDSKGYSEQQGKLLATEFRDYREFTYEVMSVFGDHDGYLRAFEWSPEEGPPVRQIQLYHASNGRGYTATATTRRENYTENERHLVSVLRRLQLHIIPIVEEAAQQVPDDSEETEP